MARGKRTEKVVDNKHHQPLSSNDSEIRIRTFLKAKVDAYATVHTLRFSHATHSLEAGIDLRQIQKALGNESLKTTEIYTHPTVTKKFRFHSPIDDMEICMLMPIYDI